MLYIYSTIYNSYTAAGESVWGHGVFIFLCVVGVGGGGGLLQRESVCSGLPSGRYRA